MATVPGVKSNWVENPPGTPDPTLILFVPCQTRTLRVNVTDQPTTAYYLWVEIPTDLEVITLPSYSTIVEDPVYTGQYWVEVYFPPNPLSNNPDKDIVFGLKDQNHVAVTEALLCHSFLERESGEWPEEYESKTMYASWERIVYISGTPTSLEDLVIAEDVADPDESYFTRQNLIIDGELLIDMDYEFGGATGFPTRFYMLEDSKISISDATLILTGSVLNTCQNTWDGIVVESGGTLLTRHQNANGTVGRVEIHDAISGITLNNGSTADIRKTDFLDNRVGIYSPPSTLPGLQLKSVQLLISGCSFREDGGYIADGANPWAGIELHDMQDFILPVCTSSPGTGCSNVIEDAWHGIILDNTSAVLSGIQIRDLNDDPLDQTESANTGILAKANYFGSLKLTGYGKTGSASLRNVADGIRLRNVSAQLEDIHMENIGDAGLDCQGSLFKTVNLLDSKLECSQYGLVFMGNANTDVNVLSNDLILSSESSSDPQYGVLLSNNSKGMFSSIRIEDNLIDMPNPIASLYSLSNTYVRIAENTIYGGDTDDEYGIRVSGGDSHVIDCNLISNSSDGDADQPGAALYLQMMNSGNVRCNETYDYPRGFELFGMNMGTPLQGNTFSDHRIGLLYDHEAENVKQFWTGNRWTNEYDTENEEYGALNTSNDLKKVTDSQFIVDDSPTMTHEQYNTSVESQHPWFVVDEEPVEGTLQCGTAPLPTCTGGPGADHSLQVNTPDSLAWWVAIDSFSSSIYGLGATWLSQRQLYRILLRNPEFVITESVWEDFMEAHASSSVGIYEEIQEGYNSLSELWVSQLEILDSLKTMRDSLQSLTSGRISDILNATEATTADSLRALWVSESSSAVSLGNTILDLEDILDSLRLDRIDTLRALNALAPADTTWEEAQQAVNDILFQMAISGLGSVDSTQTAELLSIAEECPMVIGESVFQARSILQMLTDTLVWDDDERCSMAITRSADGRPEYSTLQVSPNPANTFIRLELPGKEDSLWHLSLMNINGANAASWSLMSGTHQLILPFLPEGIYTLTGRDAKGKIHSARLVINR